MRGNDKHTHCRLCLGEKGDLLHVFESCRIPGLTAADAIMELLRFQVSECDIYPQCICNECLTKLEDFKLFKQQCERNKELLDRASARKRKDGANEVLMEGLMTRHRVECEVSIGEEDSETPIEKDALDLNRKEITMKTEPGESLDDPFAEVIESTVNQVFVPIKYEQEEGLREDDSGDIMKEEVLDIPAESYSKEEVVPGFSGSDVGISRSVSNSRVPRLKKEYSRPGGGDISAAEFPGPQSDNNGLMRVSRMSSLKKGDDFNDLDSNSSRLEEKSVKSTKKQFLCSFCGKEFPSESKLRRHSLVHTGERTFQCNQCRKMFSRKDKLQAHMSTHSKDRQFVCSLCDKAYSNRWNLKNHIIIHSGEKPFKCSLCYKAYSHKSDLKKHLIVHSGNRPYKCNECGSAFSNVSNLNVHMVIHTGNRPFVCDICCKTFRQRSNLKIHMITHSTERPYECKVCGKSFPLRKTLKMHMLSHSGEKNFICLECKKEFSRKGNLLRHLITHMGQKPFQCNTCERSFSEKRSLQKHELKHSLDRPFKCGKCSRAFVNASNLEAHMGVRHSGVRPFKCQECSKTFSRQCDLSNHLKTHS